MKRNFVLLFSLLLFFGSQSITLNAQSDNVRSERVKKYENWHNADLKKNKKNGVSTDKAYDELLKGKTSTKIIVAVIDGGVDIFHEDLKEVIWTNTKEIPDNGIDDDKNGYIDDIHGWSFLGIGKKGSLIFESLELTRENVRLNNKFYGKKAKDIPAADTADYSYFKYIKARFIKERTESEESYMWYKKVKGNWEESEAEIKKFSHKDTITFEELKSLSTPINSTVGYAKEYLLKLMKLGITKEAINSGFNQSEKSYLYETNPEYTPRKEIGDDPDNFRETKYGNNDVKGNRPFHGTFVSGIIAAKRNNNIGMNGIADNVEIMPIIVVPDGDERDKDVALAIKYAADNGAKIINMSFGKEFSPNKKEVLAAIEYATDHGVLVVHAAGNESMSNDTTMHYPSAYMNKSSRAIPSYIEVGASTLFKNKKLPASFSNYGATTVDIFAPGEDIYSTNPENTYEIASGTSFSCPVVAGVAALIWSYYPQLTSKQVKEIIIASGVSYTNKKVLRPFSGDKKAPKIKFGQLSISGKVVNVYNALKLAETYKK
jgi:subtilisin family serine protease